MDVLVLVCIIFPLAYENVVFVAGVFEFKQDIYRVTSPSYVKLDVVRKDGSAGVIHVTYKTNDSSAISGTNYVGRKHTMVFQDQQVCISFHPKIRNGRKVSAIPQIPKPENLYFLYKLYYSTI